MFAATGAWLNHKRGWRVYRLLYVNRRRRAKQRVPAREPMPLMVPSRPNQVWSADFMSDALYHGTRFRMCNVLDGCTRDAPAIEIDTSFLPSARLLRVFEQLRTQRSLPDVLRTDNGPEFLGEVFTSWCANHGILIDYIEPGKPSQNTYIERFNRTPTARTFSIPGYSGTWMGPRNELSLDARMQRGAIPRQPRRDDTHRSI